MSDPKEMHELVGRARIFFRFTVPYVEKVDKRQFLMALDRVIRIELGYPVPCLNGKCQNQVYIKDKGGVLVCAQCKTPLHTV